MDRSLQVGAFLLCIPLPAYAQETPRPERPEEAPRQGLPHEPKAPLVFDQPLRPSGFSEIGFWHWLGPSVSLDYWGASDLTHSTKYRDAFDAGLSGSLDAGITFSFPISETAVFEDVFLGGGASLMQTSFRGGSVTDEAMGELEFDRLELTTFGSNIRIGLGSYADHDCNWHMLYIAGSVGATAFEPTRYRRTDPVVEDRRFIRSSYSLNASLGIGFDAKLDNFGFSVEAGYRSFGRPSHGSSVQDDTHDRLSTLYLELGLNYAF